MVPAPHMLYGYEAPEAYAPGAFVYPVRGRGVMAPATRALVFQRILDVR